MALHLSSPQMCRRHVHNLPAELINQSFAFLNFENLRYAAQVCVRWRDIGIEHPGFWRGIEICSATSGSMDLLAARLGQSNGRPFAFTIDIEGLHPLIETRLLSLLAAMMPSVQYLRIHLDSRYQADLWPVLNRAAPQLADFSLKLYSQDRIMPDTPLDARLLDKTPGLIRQAHIEDVHIAELPAFSNLRLLRLIHPSGSVLNFPSFLFQCCPWLEELVIYCGAITLEEPLSTAFLQGLSRLIVLDVYVDLHNRTQFAQSMPMQDIPVVIIGAPPDFDVFYDFLEPVRSPFRLRILRGVAKFFFVTVEDDTWGYQRTFQELISDYDSDVAADGNERANLLFANDQFPHQILSLQITASLWNMLVPYLSSYGVVIKLILDLDEPDANYCWVLPSGAMRFSNLATLVLEARNDFIWVAAEDIVHFVDNVLSAWQCRYLELNCVLLSGDRRPVLQRFESVSYSPMGLTPRPIVLKPKP